MLGDIDWVSFFSGQENGGVMENTSNGVDLVVGESDENGGRGDSSNKVVRKSGGGRMKKVTRPRFAFQTRSADDILDDGYRWRKYGQKAVKNSVYPR